MDYFLAKENGPRFDFGRGRLGAAASPCIQHLFPLQLSRENGTFLNYGRYSETFRFLVRAPGKIPRS